MPDTTYGRAVSLAWTGGSGSPISNIQSYDFSQTKELSAFLNGNARVQSYYKGMESASIKVTTKDIGSVRLISKGTIVTNLILTLQGAIQGDNTSSDNYKVTFSQAMVNSDFSFSHDNSDSAPAIAELEFILCRKEADAADPTVVFAVVT